MGVATISEVPSSIGFGKINQKEKKKMEQEFLVNQTKQIAIKAVNQDEAIKKVLNGEGTIASMNMSVSVRPQSQPTQPQILGSRSAPMLPKQ